MSDLFTVNKYLLFTSRDLWNLGKERKGHDDGDQEMVKLQAVCILQVGVWVWAYEKARGSKRVQSRAGKAEGD